MTEREKTFIRQLRITLISIIGPMIITGLILTGINLQRINANEKHIEALENSKVSREINMLYVNDLRELIVLTKKELENKNVDYDKKLAEINSRMDRLIRDMYEVKTHDATTKPQINKP